MEQQGLVEEHGNLPARHRVLLTLREALPEVRNAGFEPNEVLGIESIEPALRADRSDFTAMPLGGLLSRLAFVKDFDRVINRLARRD